MYRWQLFTNNLFFFFVYFNHLFHPFHSYVYRYNLRKYWKFCASVQKRIFPFIRSISSKLLKIIGGQCVLACHFFLLFQFVLRSVVYLNLIAELIFCCIAISAAHFLQYFCRLPIPGLSSFDVIPQFSHTKYGSPWNIKY